MRLTVIGGSGGYPGHGRPCSGYIVETDGFGLLIDPGYGVATALSVENAPTFDAVLVSHAHPDHCADLNPLLRKHVWAPDPLAPMPIYALPGALDAVMALDRPSLLEGSHAVHDFEAGDELSIGPFNVLTALLPHPRPNVGVRISVGSASLVYTGDCGPSDELINLAQDADLFLAEASYAREVPEEIIGSSRARPMWVARPPRRKLAGFVLTHLIPKTDESDAIAAAEESFADPISVARPGVVIEVPGPG